MPLVVYTKDTLAVFLEGGMLHTTSPDGAEDVTSWERKDIRFLPQGWTEAEAVADGSPRAMIFELK